MTVTSPPTGPTSEAERSSWKLSERNIVRSEWTKLRSVRSNVITLLAAGVALVAFGALFSALAGAGPEGGSAGPPGQSDDSLSVAFAGLNLAQLILGVIGALFVTSEYSTGLIRTVFTFVPKRGAVLRAKAVVIGLVTLVVMTIASFVTFFVSQAVYSGDGATYALGDPGVLRAVIGVGIYGAGITALGVALGFLLRNTAAAVAALIAVLMVAPGLSGLLPDSIGDVVTKLLPSNAGQAFTQVSSSSDLLNPWAGLAVFVLWVVGLLMVATWALRHRDA